MKQNILTLAEMANSGNKWAIVKINETGFYKADIIKKAKRIDCVYLVNLHEPTHLCSIEVAYPLISLKNFMQETEGFTDDEIWEIEMDQTMNEVRYYNENYKADLVKYYETGELEEIADYEAANPCVC